MISRDDRARRNGMNNVRKQFLSLLLPVLPQKVTNHDDLEQLILERKKVTEINILFYINEVDYCTLTKVFF